jgi:hypothetical protein
MRPIKETPLSGRSTLLPSLATKTPLEKVGSKLAQPSQLWTIFGVFAISFAVKSRVSIAKL